MLLELLVVSAAIVVCYREIGKLERPMLVPAAAAATKRASSQLVRMMEFANRLYSERKWLAAERAYLAVLKRDHQNVDAYNHLGVIYSAQKNYVDAIECFKISASLAPAAAGWQNLGLAYFKHGDYVRAAASFEKSVIAEPNAQRFLALGRTYKKLEDNPHMITAFERAVELDPTRKALQQLFEAYRLAGEREKAVETYQRLQNIEA